jgi:hypothetical protein
MALYLAYKHFLIRLPCLPMYVPRYCFSKVASYELLLTEPPVVHLSKFFLPYLNPLELIVRLANLPIFGIYCLFCVHNDSLSLAVYGFRCSRSAHNGVYDRLCCIYKPYRYLRLASMMVSTRGLKVWF